MSESSLGLGSGTTTCASANLQLRFDCSVSLTSRDLDLSSFHHLRREKLLSKDIWIRKGHDFRFSFHFVFDNDRVISTGLQEDYLGRLSHTLEAAELWSQLSLRVASIDRGIHFESASRPEAALELKLNVDHSYNDTTKNQGSSSAAYAHDAAGLTPPPAIPAVCLQGVKLLLHFSSLQPRDHGEPELGMEKLPEADKLPSTSPGPAWAAQKIKRHSHFTRSATDELYSQELDEVLDDLLTWNDNTSMFNSFFEDQNIETVRDLSRPHSLLDTPLPRPDIHKPVKLTKRTRNITANGSTEIMLKATDAVLRNVICANPISVARSSQTSLDKDFSHLAQLAPVVFAPRFSQALDKSKNLIPAIAKFLSTFIVKKKLSRYTGVGQDRPGSREHIPPGVDTATMDPPKSRRFYSDSFSAHLWMTAVNGLDKTEAARRLKPLESAAVNCTMTPKAANLDDLCAYFAEEEETGVEDDFARMLFEDEHKDAERYEPQEQSFLGLYDKGLSSSLSQPVGSHETRVSHHEGEALPAVGLLVDLLHDADDDEGQIPHSFDELLISTDSHTCHIDDLKTSAQLKAEDGTEADATAVFEELTVLSFQSRPSAVMDHEDHTEYAWSPLLEQEDDLDGARPPEMDHAFQVIGSLDLSDTFKQVGNDESPAATVDEDLDMLSHKLGSGTSLLDMLGSKHVLSRSRKRRQSVASSAGDLFELQALNGSETDMVILRDSEIEDQNLDFLDLENITNPSASPDSSQGEYAEQVAIVQRPLSHIPTTGDTGIRIAASNSDNFLMWPSSRWMSSDPTITHPFGDEIASGLEVRPLAIKRRKTLPDATDDDGENHSGEDMLLS